MALASKACRDLAMFDSGIVVSVAPPMASRQDDEAENITNQPTPSQRALRSLTITSSVNLSSLVCVVQDA